MSDPNPNPDPYSYPINRIQPRTDPSTPLTNLTIIKTRLDSLSRHLTNSLTSHVILPPHHLSAISSELTSSIRHVILNATALLDPQPKPEPKPEPNIIELDAVELLAEHVHVCTLCGKGFKRDANLRMHMRAHGDQYKSPQALAKPPAAAEPAEAGSAAGSSDRDTRFSCPYVGCNRNKESVGFKPLKSVICVKNHFKRSHCPKKFRCERCNVKSFAVVGDLRTHLRVCGASSSGGGGGDGGGESEFDELLQGFIQSGSIDDFFRF